MEFKINLDGCSRSDKYYVRVSVGVTQKFARYTPDCVFQFDEPKGAACVDVFQHVGTCDIVRQPVRSSASTVSAMSGVSGVTGASECPEPQKYAIKSSTPQLKNSSVTVNGGPASESAGLLRSSASRMTTGSTRSKAGARGVRRTVESLARSALKSLHVGSQQTPADVELVIPDAEKPRLLVLTDAGEEVDDEAALWLMNQHMHANLAMAADVVFVTGNPAKRAMRWARVRNNCDWGRSPLQPGRINFFLGPDTHRDMRYSPSLDMDELKQAGITKLNSFLGGTYDIVLQISPVEGFDPDFENPPEGARGALARVTSRKGAKVPVYIVVGQEGSTNFPLDSLHRSFKKSLLQQGFIPIHVEKSNYMNWHVDFLETLPCSLADMVLEDEWNKAVGRIAPHAASLFVRFRVNTAVNYVVVDRAFAMLETHFGEDADYLKAVEWWESIATDVHAKVMGSYIKRSRDSDSLKGSIAFGNPPVSSVINGMEITWQSIMSAGCISDICALGPEMEAALPGLTVDDAMGKAVTMMTKKLMLVYAFNAYSNGRQPSIMQFEPYLAGNGTTAPMDWHAYPQLLGDNKAAIQKEVVGNPMYDPAGMFVALLMLASTREEVLDFIAKLQEPAPLLDKDARVDAMRATFEGLEPPRALVVRFTGDPAGGGDTPPDTAAEPGSIVGQRVSTGGSGLRMLFFTNGGRGGGNESALWMIFQFLNTFRDGHVDIVFVTGSPTERAASWARILNSAGVSMDSDAPGALRMHYFVGPETEAVWGNSTLVGGAEELRRAGLGDIGERPFGGGRYDIVAQGSPLYGFDAVGGALARIRPREQSARTPLYIVFGEEGATNFPLDPLHRGFKRGLVRKGFVPAHAGRRYLLCWSAAYFDYLPPKLVATILESSWNKTIGRIAPSDATLLVRFRLNTYDNYISVHHVFKRFQSLYKSEAAFRKAAEWWDSIADDVGKAIMEGYVRQSRIDDDGISSSFGNPQISTKVPGMGYTWESQVAAEFRDELLGASEDISPSMLPALTVDEAMGQALILMTAKLFKIYAYNAITSQGEPIMMQCLTYVRGTDAIAPMDTCLFPRLFGDLYEIQKEVSHYPMYAVSGMILALAAMAASDRELAALITKLVQQADVLDREKIEMTIKGVLKGEGPGRLADRFFRTAESAGDGAYAFV